MRFDHARGFHPNTFYCFDAQHAARATSTTQLDFWDLVYANADTASGVVALHIRHDVTARHILSRPTFYKRMQEALAANTLLAHDGERERGEYLCRLAAWPPADAFWKARAYVHLGWIAFIRQAHAKAVLNLLHYLVANDAACRADTPFVFDISTLWRASRHWPGKALSRKQVSAGVARLAELGLVSRTGPDGSQRHGFQPLALQHPPPDRKTLAQEVAEIVGLHPDTDAAWLRLLTDFVAIGGHRLRETPAIYRHLLKYLPAPSAATLDVLRAIVRQQASRGKTGYRDVLADYQRAQRQKQVTPIESLPINVRLETNAVIGRPITWPEGTRWARLASVALVCRWRGAGEDDSKPAPHLYLWWRGEMRHVGICAPRARRRVTGFDLTPHLRDLQPDEPLTLVIATPSGAPAGRLRAVFRLGIANGGST